MYKRGIDDANLNMQPLTDVGPGISFPAFGEGASDGVKRRLVGRISHLVQVLKNGTIQGAVISLVNGHFIAQQILQLL